MKIELGKGFGLKLCPAHIFTLFSRVCTIGPLGRAVCGICSRQTCLVTTSRRGLQLGLRYRYMVDYVYDFDYDLCPYGLMTMSMTSQDTATLGRICES